MPLTVHGSLIFNKIIGIGECADVTTLCEKLQNANCKHSLFPGTRADINELFEGMPRFIRYIFQGSPGDRG